MEPEGPRKLTDLPSNVHIYEDTVDVLEQLKSRPGDEHMLVQVLAICGQSIVQKHENARVVFSSLTTSHLGFTLVTYIANVRMPLTVRVSDKQTTAMKQVNMFRVRGIETYYEEGAMNVEIRVDSNLNPLDILEMSMINTTLTRTQIPFERLISEKEPEEKTRGTNKRNRQG